MPKAVVIEMRLIVQRDHMQTDFRFQLSLFIIKLGKKNSVDIIELDLQFDMLCSHYKIESDHWTTVWISAVHEIWLLIL